MLAWMRDNLSNARFQSKWRIVKKKKWYQSKLMTSSKTENASCNCFASFVIINECDKHLRVARFEIERKQFCLFFLIQFSSSRFTIFRKNLWITLLRLLRIMRESFSNDFHRVSLNLNIVYFVAWLLLICELSCIAIVKKL